MSSILVTLTQESEDKNVLIDLRRRQINLLYGPHRPQFLASQNNNNTDFIYKHFSFYYSFFF